jgi:hypothetical protein
MNQLELKKKINELFIVREDDGSYNLFGKYSIKLEEGLYKVSVCGENSNFIFSSLKHAVTWCVFEKNNKQKEQNRIVELDQLLASLDAIIMQHTKILKKAKIKEDQIIISAKLFEQKIKKKQALEEIEKYTTISRYLQGKKYKENTLKS